MESVVLQVKYIKSKRLTIAFVLSIVILFSIQHTFGSDSAYFILSLSALIPINYRYINNKRFTDTSSIAFNKESVSWKNNDTSEFLESELIHVNELNKAVFILTLKTQNKVYLVLACPLTMRISANKTNKSGYRNLRRLRQHLIHRALI